MPTPVRPGREPQGRVVPDTDEQRQERPSLVPDDNGETWDVFCSHANEEKEAIAEPLAEELRTCDLTV